MTNSNDGAVNLLPYKTPAELFRAFKDGQKFVLHYHGEIIEVTHMQPREHVVYVQPPGLPVKVKPDGSSAEGPGKGIWLAHASQRPEAVDRAGVVEEPSKVWRWRATIAAPDDWVYTSKKPDSSPIIVIEEFHHEWRALSPIETRAPAADAVREAVARAITRSYGGRMCGPGQHRVARWHERQSDLVMNSLHCGDNAGTIASSRRKAEWHDECAVAIRSLAADGGVQSGDTGTVRSPSLSAGEEKCGLDVKMTLEDFGEVMEAYGALSVIAGHIRNDHTPRQRKVVSHQERSERWDNNHRLWEAKRHRGREL